MFSRDSQFSRDSKRPQSSVHDAALTNSGQPATASFQGQVHTPPQTKHQGISQPNSQISSQHSAQNSAQATATGKPSSLPVERTQSWQIAPNLLTSFRYAWAGISYAFRTQRNFRIHTGVAVIAILLCIALKVAPVESAVICLTIGAVLVMEILNTALESLVDLTVGQTYHDLAKIAKDCAAGAVFMSAIVAMLVAVLIFVPNFLSLIG